MDDGCCTTTTEDADSAIVLSREELQNIKDCCDEMDEQTPSTSSAKSSPKRTGLVRKLVRVPCPTNENTPFTVHGGAAKGKLIMIDIVRREDLYGILSPDDRLLSIEGVAVSGMVYSEVRRLLEKLCSEREQVALEVVSAPSLSEDIAEILEGKMNPELQNVIRDNLYAKTVPYTTRSAREGEIDGEHYKFVTEEEFNRLKERGCLLEHGSYQDFLYGTPRPVEIVDQDDDDMVSATLGKGPLPPNWEIGYAENGEKYFIDHNSGTTTWDDPRLLPDGWEQVDDPYYGTFYVDHLHKRTQYERPGTAVDPEHFATPSTASTAYIGDYDKENPYDQFRGKGNYDVIPTRPSNGHYATAPHQNGHQNVFTRDVNQLRGEMISTTIIKGPKGLGFTLIGNDASSKGDEFIQVKSILAGGPAAENGSLLPGDVLVRVNGELLLGATQAEACRVFISIPVGDPVAIQICRGYPLMIDPNNRIITENVYATGGRARSLDLQDIEIYKGPEGFGFTIADSVSGQRVRKILHPAQCPNLMEGDTIVELDGRDVRNIPHTQLVDMLRDCQIGHRGRLVVRRSSPKHRSRTPTAAFRYGEQRATPVSTVTGPRSKTPAPTTTRQPSTEMYSGTLGRPSSLHKKSQDVPDFVSRMRPSSTTLGFATPNYVPISQFSKERTSETVTINLIRKPNGFGFRLLGGAETNTLLTVGQIVAAGAAFEDGRMQEGDEIVEIDNTNVEGATHEEAVRKLEQAAKNKHVKMVVRRPKTEMSHSVSLPGVERKTVASEYDVVLNRTDHDGFGFIIISSIDRNGSTIGQILENSPASRCGKLQVGDRVVAVNGRDILNMTHGEIVNLIKHSGLTVRLTIAPPGGPDAPLASSTLIRNGHHIPPLATSNSIQNSNFAPYGSLRSPVQPYAVVPDPSSRYSRLSNGHHDVIPPESDGTIISVELERGNRGFGFSIRGGQEFGAMPLFVLRIAEDGPAAADSRLKVGDQLITINGRDCTGLTHEEAISIIKSQPTVRLTVRRRSPS